MKVILTSLKVKASTKFFLQCFSFRTKSAFLSNSVSINKKYNNWAQFLSIAEFTYYNFKNACISYILFKSDCGYYFWFFFKDKYNIYFKPFLPNKLAIILKELINHWCQNLIHTQSFPKLKSKTSKLYIKQYNLT